jgi:hypothetical protein
MSKSSQGTRPKPKQPGSPRPLAARPSDRLTSTQRAAKEQTLALEARQRRTRTVGIGSIVLVVLVLASLIVVKLAGAGNSPTGASASSPAAGSPISTAITTRLTSIPLSTLNAAPRGGLITSPQAITDRVLRAVGKPELLYVGAEFCPICASERWAMYVALSKFGTFSPQPGRIHSAVRDGDIPTLTFYKTTYTSPYLTFTPVETTTNQPDGNYYVPLQKLSPAQLRLFESHTNGFPWLDFGGKRELTSVQYNPNDLEGQSFDDIASAIGNNSTPIGADIDASARVLVQTICSTMTGDQPAHVCSAVGHV